MIVGYDMAYGNSNVSFLYEISDKICHFISLRSRLRCYSVAKNLKGRGLLTHFCICMSLLRQVMTYHKPLVAWYNDDKLDGLVQERRNSIPLAMELRLSCTSPSNCQFDLRDQESVKLKMDFPMKMCIKCSLCILRDVSALGTRSTEADLIGLHLHVMMTSLQWRTFRVTELFTGNSMVVLQQNGEKCRSLVISLSTTW